MKTDTQNIKTRLEYLCGELRAERISLEELAELQSLAAHIEPGDVELLEAAGVPEREEEQTEVIFRMWRTDPKTCLALFPYDDAGRGLCTSYEHIGQHGGADYVHCIKKTRPATPAEYADLKSELVTIGYRLKVITKRARR